MNQNFNDDLVDDELDHLNEQEDLQKEKIPKQQNVFQQQEEKEELDDDKQKVKGICAQIRLLTDCIENGDDACKEMRFLMEFIQEQHDLMYKKPVVLKEGEEEDEDLGYGQDHFLQQRQQQMGLGGQGGQRVFVLNGGGLQMMQGGLGGMMGMRGMQQQRQQQNMQQMLIQRQRQKEQQIKEAMEQVDNNFNQLKEIYQFENKYDVLVREFVKQNAINGSNTQIGQLAESYIVHFAPQLEELYKAQLEKQGNLQEEEQEQQEKVQQEEKQDNQQNEQVEKQNVQEEKQVEVEEKQVEKPIEVEQNDHEDLDDNQLNQQQPEEK